MPPGSHRSEERPRRDRPEEAGTEHADQIRQYREQQAKAAAKETVDATAPVARKRTKAEAIANGIGITATKIDDIDFHSFSEEDRAMLIETMNAMKDILEAAIPRAVENRKKPT
jgi:hypothetical protein